MKNHILGVLLLIPCVLTAQPRPPAQSFTPSTVTFELRWPASDPQWFELSFQSDGSARYRSLRHQEPGDPAAEPFELAFTLSPHSRQFVFATASQLPRFQSSLDKIKVAFTGTKTLRCQDASGNLSTISYNYSSSAELTAITELMQSISESIELSEMLQFQLRFDKLAIESTLRGAEDLVSNHHVPEPQLLSPVLQRIADDPAVMNIARQRARRILLSVASASQR